LNFSHQILPVDPSYAVPLLAGIVLINSCRFPSPKASNFQYDQFATYDDVSGQNWSHNNFVN
tara:strand:+ start:661 stop:846 length:186 start_codon:yes stop_codon:yes gene_type:complete